MAIFKNKYRTYTDEQLMEFLKQQETFAFDELYKRYSRRLLFYFYRALGGNEHKAQDFLQDTFLKIVEKPGLFCSGKKFSIWIFTVAHNLCKNEYRRMFIRKNIDNNADMDSFTDNFDNEYNNAEQRVDQKLFRSALLRELEKFDAKRRITFLLRHQQNFSIKEISEILGCSEGTVKSRLFYTTKKLARKLHYFNPYKTEVS